MADQIIDGRTRVSFVPIIASATLAPTVAELNAGTLLHSRLTPTGLAGFEATQEGIDNSAFDSTYNTQLPGRKSQTGMSLMFKDTEVDPDPILVALAEGTDGYVVIRDGLPAATAYAATTQKVEVHPIRTGLHQVRGRNEQNALRRTEVMCWSSGEPRKKLAILS